MPRAILAIARPAVPFIRGNLATLLPMLQTHYGSKVALLEIDRIEDIPAGGAQTVFVIGEHLAPPLRHPGCQYVLINLSVVTQLGSPLAASPRGMLQIHRKARALRHRLAGYDALLDYYPAQTRILKRRLSLPVFGFIPWSDPAAPSQGSRDQPETIYDVCFVGGKTPRRRALLDQLRAEGLRLSPSKGVMLEQAAAQSACTLNVHLQRSNHLEIPRILGALSVGSPVVSEDSFGIADILPPKLIEIAPYRQLSGRVLSFLSDPSRVAERAAQSASWYRDTLVPQAEQMLIKTLHQIDTLPAQ